MMKSALRYAGRDLDAMKATAEAQKERSLEMFKDTLKEYQDRELSTFSRLNYRRTPKGPPHPLPFVGAVRQSTGAKSTQSD